MTVSDVTPQQVSDARQSPRVNVSWAARVVVGPQSYLEARVINVSADGLALVCEHAFQSGAVLQVLIALPDFQDHSKYQYPTVQLKAVFHVVKGAKFRIGTRFVHMDAATRAMIDAWVRGG